MSLLIKLVDGNPIVTTEASFRAQNPQTVYAKTISNAQLAEQGVYRVTTQAKPDTADSEVAELGDPTQGENGQWVREWTVRPKTQAELDDERAAWRKTAFLYRRDFCIALKRAGVLSAAQAIQAAKGDWPQAFTSALAQLPQDAQEEAEIEWAAVQEIRRNHPMIALLGSAANMTDEQIDALFGWP